MLFVVYTLGPIVHPAKRVDKMYDTGVILLEEVLLDGRTYPS